MVLGLRSQVLPRSQLGKACEYLLDHWDALAAHQQHSFTRLDNKLVEDAIRPIGKLALQSASLANVPRSLPRSGSHRSQRQRYPPSSRNPEALPQLRAILSASTLQICG